MARAKEMAGLRFGALLVVSRAGRYGSMATWTCRCDCGGSIVLRGNELRAGARTSCGCRTGRKYPGSLRHGGKSCGIVKPEYRTWMAMKCRCYNANSIGYKRYGGRGIRVCDRWLHSYENFIADMGPKPTGYSIERIDPRGNYEPSNCKWIPLLDQSKNTTKTIFFCGERLADWARARGVPYMSAYAKYRRGTLRG